VAGLERNVGLWGDRWGLFCGGVGLRFAELWFFRFERTDVSVGFRLDALMYQ
jgi:hypothetical protein